MPFLAYIKITGKMISPACFHFLRQLKNNNHKEWFDANRLLYQKIKAEFETLVDLLIREICTFDSAIYGITARDSIFRINRDIRFSSNKMPYKTNLGAFIAKGGRKGIHAGYYIHVEPENCFLAGGIYMPSAPMLKAIRTAILDNAQEFLEIVQTRDFIDNFGYSLGTEKLRNLPKGFPADFPYADYLKYKSYTVLKEESDETYQQASFMNEAISVFKAMKPFNDFLNNAVSCINN